MQCEHVYRRCLSREMCVMRHELDKRSCLPPNGRVSELTDLSNRLVDTQNGRPQQGTTYRYRRIVFRRGTLQLPESGVC